AILPTIDNGLSLYLNAEDFTNSPQTTSWIDRSGCGNNANVYNFGYTSSSGSDGNGRLVFDGTNDEVNIPNPINCSGRYLTFEVNVKSSSTSSGGTLIRRDGGNGKGYYILKEQSGKYQIQLLDSSATNPVT